MAASKSVWGIDVGQCALKALKLRDVDGQGLQVEAFDIIEHPKILSQPDADRSQLIRNALEQFLARNSVAGCEVAVAVPGQSSFTRFVKLPPVEPKKIPDIVRFEAEQQIPFPIDEVIWRWQTFVDPDSPDVEVGIFAIKRSDVHAALSNFQAVDLDVDYVQMAPLALYNFMVFDAQVAPEGATLLVDIGADKTDLVVADGASIWARTIQIGGNNFTEALVRAFKLSFPKAEKLKRTAATSKYARQVFQAMRPVFADLVQEIQRSIGYYTSLHRDARFKRLLGMGNGFRLPGLQKFLEQNLNIPVAKADSFNRLVPTNSLNAPAFAENSLAFGVAYGLALQGLGHAAVETNLLPGEMASARRWSAKRPWFAAAAAALLVAVAAKPYANWRTTSELAKGEVGTERAAAFVSEYKASVAQQQQYEDARTQGLNKIGEVEQLFAYRDFWPSFQKVLASAMQSAAHHQPLLDAYGTAVTKEQREEAMKNLLAVNRGERKYFIIEERVADYYADINEAKFEASLDRRSPAMTGGLGVMPSAGTASGAEGSKPQRGFLIKLVGRTPLQHDAASNMLSAIGIAVKTTPNTAFKVIDEVHPVQPMSTPGAAGSPAGPGAASSTEMVDPWTGEDMSTDTRFALSFRVVIIDPADQPQQQGQ